MARLSEEQVQQALGALRGWAVVGGALEKTFAFKDFVAAMAFVNRVADAAEAAGHHPDIDIRYNRVRLALTTHDEGGLTGKDVQVAGEIERAG